MTASTIPSIGIDFGGTSIKMGVVKGAEVIAHAPSIATQEYGNPDQLIEAIAQFVNMLRLNHPEVQAIGMGMPGFVNFYQGTVYTLTNVPGWNNVPVRDMLQAACGLPVYVENDANCMAYAEWKLGAGKGKKTSGLPDPRHRRWQRPDRERRTSARVYLLRRGSWGKRASTTGGAWAITATAAPWRIM